MPDGTVEPSPLGIPPGRRDWILVPLALIWIIPGLLGHEPWKPDEGYTIGMVMHIVESGDWVVPMLAGEPFMEKPPLFYGTAALLARAFSPWFLPVHQAMALAAALYMALTVTFTFLAGREVGGREAGLTAALGLLGCLGLVVRAHSAITDTALWT
ncbi:MAG: UDP phosphate-alpha-4-amino-4-deoxy-L- arabinose arabinosyl transferase, partial [Planctomycetes bacterium]|nr:UDP phosphate-alpha-4-amino-4-deoxy-L- arabinose arabinosyl transferase [Planctomycetota bacterium]